MTTLIFVYLDGFGFYIRKLLLLLYFPNRFLFSSNVENLGNISSNHVKFTLCAALKLWRRLSKRMF